MKIKFVMLLILTISTALQAQEPITTIDKDYMNKKFYFAMGYGDYELGNEHTRETINTKNASLAIGTKIHKNMALEARVSNSFSTEYNKGLTTAPNDAYSGSIVSWGVYAKPSYRFESLEPYFIAGFGGTMIRDFADGNAYEKGLHWGYGVEFHYTENIAISLDYINMYEGRGFDYRAANNDINSNILTFRFILIANKGAK